MISSFAASVGLAACNDGSSIGNNTTSNESTTSNHTSSNSTVPTTETHSHNYNQKITTEKYKASDADCEHADTYYYSCICGDSCSETFEQGDPLGHDYSNWSYHYRETVDGEDKKTRTCSRCDRVEVVTLTNSQSVQNLIFEISEDQKTCKIIGYKSYYDDERDKNIVIPEIWSGYSVTSIGESAFSGCSSLTSIVIPDSVISIGKSAFSRCTSLISIVIPDSVTSIGGSAFSGCSSLESITLPFVGGSGSATSASSSTLFGYIFGNRNYIGSYEAEQYYENGLYYTYYIPSSLRFVTITGGNVLYGAFSGC